MSIIYPNLAKEIDKKDILRVADEVEKGKIVLKKIRRYYIEINRKKYPSKDIVREAAKLKGINISNYKLKGGESTNKYLSDMGFSVKTIGEVQSVILDTKVFNNYFKEYVSYCNRSQWLRYREAYKFRFSRWLSAKVDFNKQNDDEILSICIDSQNQRYNVDSNTNGLNFITSSLMFKDDFIVKKDIEALRRLYEGDEIEDIDYSGGATSFPKFSIWAGTLIPSMSRVYANEELTSGIATLFNLEKYPKSGVKSFVLANECLNVLADTILNEYENEAYDLLSLVFPNNTTFSDSDLSWIVQDFILFLNRRLINKNVNYFWVNQGGKYKQEINTSCIVAPINNVHHHKRLKEMVEDDIVLHYSGSNILAKSVVIKEFEELPRPYENKLEKELVVKLRYEELVNPISIEMIQEKLSKHKNLLPKKYSPFDKNLKPYQSYCLNFNESLFNILLSDKTIEFKTNNVMKNPNIILYGPPGTGKTYNTIEMAYEIIHGQKTETHRIAQEYFQSNKGTQIEFITFHQNMAYEDFVQGIKPDINSDDIKFVKRDGLFKTICDRAKKNYLSSRKKVVQEDVSFEEVFNEFIDKLQEEEVSQIEVKMKKASYFITEVNDRSILFSNSKGVQKSLNISTLKGMFYERENKTIIGGMQNYYNPLLDELLKIELEKKGLSNGEVIPLKNYVLIIDEINRANISRVFGELITLLEKDKRLGQENEISVTLPSGDELVVPPNLYIIGTMNTADKSIALLDIALRRRFDFKKMFPKTELVLSEYKDAFDRINKKIKELKGADFQIGHSYFMGADFSLDYNMESKVLPLLYEYFMNDEDAIKEVLSTAGFEFKDSKESDSGLIEFVDIKKVEPKDA